MNGTRTVHIIFVAVAALYSTAAAQDRLLPGESVSDRQRPALDASGLPMGAFRLYPELHLTAEHNSNLFAADKSEQDDLITIVAPRFELKSDWSRHALDLTAGAKLADYRDRPQESYDNLHVGGNLQLEPLRNQELRLGGSWQSLHEDRSSPDDVRGSEPTRLERSVLSAAYARRTGRILLDGRLQRRTLDYDDVPGETGIINNDDRDRSRHAVDLRAGLQLSRDLDLLLRAVADEQRYVSGIDDNGLNRSSRGLRGGLGLRGAVGGAGYTEAFIGYAERRYDDAQLADTTTPWFDLLYRWNPSGLTTITLQARRTIDETTFAPASGYRATRFGLQFEHELLRNLLLEFRVFTQRDDYIGADRKDRRDGYSFSVHYLANRYLRVSLNAARRSRLSTLQDQPADNFDIDRISLTFTLQR